MNYGCWLKQSQKILAQKGIETARLDCLVLLEDATQKDRSHILAHDELTLETDIENVLNSQIERRAKHEPLAYIRGFTEFYGRRFIVSPAVLIPRPETELIIDMLKLLTKNGQSAGTDSLEDGSSAPRNDQTANEDQVAKRSKTSLLAEGSFRIADIGCGSGAIGITAGLELPRSEVQLIDIDRDALKIAASNVVMHTMHAEVIQADLVPDSAIDYHIILCNLPYVPDGMKLNKAARYEPKIALFAGVDGLDLYRRFFKNIRLRQRFLLYILLEAFPSQHPQLELIARAAGFQLLKTDDFIQVYVPMKS